MKYQNKKKQSLPEFLRLNHFILPSFFELLIYLKESNLLDQVFIRFRTFGWDAEHLTEEFNLFSQGKHPYFPGFTLETSSGDHFSFLSKDQFGIVCRNLFHNFILLGTCKDLPNIENIECKDTLMKSILSHYSLNESDPKFITSERDMYNYLSGSNPCLRSIFIRDHYDFWENNGRKSDHGKFHPVDYNDSSTLLNVFFDDYLANRETNKIINVFDLDKEGNMDYSKCLEMNYLVPVDTFNAIMDKNYFKGIVSKLIQSKRFGCLKSTN